MLELRRSRQPQLAICRQFFDVVIRGCGVAKPSYSSFRPRLTVPIAGAKIIDMHGRSIKSSYNEILASIVRLTTQIVTLESYQAELIIDDKYCLTAIMSLSKTRTPSSEERNT